MQIKNNLGPQAESLGYEIVGDKMDAKLEWRGKSNLTSADLLAPDAAGEDRSDIAEAEDYIREQLAQGPKLVRDLKKGTEINERTLQRAGKRVGISRSRDGENGPWRWGFGDRPRQQTPYPTALFVVGDAESCRLREDDPVLPPAEVEDGTAPQAPVTGANGKPKGASGNDLKECVVRFEPADLETKQELPAQAPTEEGTEWL